MSDIFTIRGVDAVLKMGKKHYRFADPIFPEKVKIQKQMRELDKNKDTMEFEEYSLEVYELNKKLIKLFLPEITQDDLDTLGEFAFQALLIKVLSLTKDQFGATIDKISDAEKKQEAAL